MNDWVRFGILGLGMGANRARVIPYTNRAKLVCVCDLREELAKQIAMELTCEWTTSFEKMLSRNDIDVVGVFTPSGTHCDNAIKAMEAGKNVFITKPMDIRVDKCNQAIEVSKKTGKILGVDFDMRYEPKYRKVKLVIEKGTLGKLYLCDVRMKLYRGQDYYDGGYPLGWRSRKQTEGGSAANQGAHAIDFIQWIMGPVKNVYGKISTFGHEIETEDFSLAFLNFQNNAWGSIITTTASYPDLGMTIEITAQNGTIIMKNKEIIYKVKDKSDASLNEYKLDSSLPKNIIADMVSAIKYGTPLMCDGNEGRKASIIFNAIYESSRTGKTVEIRQE